ncbi:MAG: hypothetical protein QNJ98_10325 [Planctomycetota bacterium]|nr:hypothetical protein [Planctomycetota bacterium]
MRDLIAAVAVSILALGVPNAASAAENAWGHSKSSKGYWEANQYVVEFKFVISGTAPHQNWVNSQGNPAETHPGTGQSMGQVVESGANGLAYAVYTTPDPDGDQWSATGTGGSTTYHKKWVYKFYFENKPPTGSTVTMNFSYTDPNGDDVDATEQFTVP